MTQYQYTDEEFTSAVSTSHSMSELIEMLGMCRSAWNYRSFAKRIELLGLSVGHWHGPTGDNCAKRFRANSKEQVLEEVFTEGSLVYGSSLRRYVIKYNLLEYKCNLCGAYEWRGQKLSLQLDHKSGNKADNRLDNLQWLCPNCHSQTPTWGGKQLTRPKCIRKCIDCGEIISKKALRCHSCASSISPHPDKIDWPPFDQLIIMVETTSYSEVARKLGVSDNAVRKRIKRQM